MTLKVVFGLVFMAAASAHPLIGQSRWMRVYSSSAATINADTTSLAVQSDGSHQVWIDWRWPRPRKDTPNSKSYVSEKSLLQVKCTPLTYRTMKWVDYDEAGNVVDSGNHPGEWNDSVVPDSIGEALFKNLCALFDGRSFSPTGELPG